MEKERSNEGGFSVIEATAILAVLLLIVSTVWKTQSKISDQNSNLSYKMQPTLNETNDQAPDPYAQALADVTAPIGAGTAVVEQLMNSYVASKNQGTYTPEYAAALGSSLAPMISAELAYKAYTEKDLITNPDTSEATSLAYQSSLHDALAPLRTNTTPEFEFFAMYAQTKDPQYLTELSHVASLYQSAASNTAILVVPADVVQYHLAILNSLQEFAAVLNALVTNADDPIESTVLLRNYNSGEKDVLDSFNALRAFYVKKYAPQHS